MRRTRKVFLQDTGSVYSFEGGYAGVYADWEDSVFCLPEEVKAAYRENCTEEWKKELREEERFLMYFNVAAELYGNCPVENVVELYKRVYRNGKEYEFSVLAFLKDVAEKQKMFCAAG